MGVPSQQSVKRPRVDSSGSMAIGGAGQGWPANGAAAPRGWSAFVQGATAPRRWSGKSPIVSPSGVPPVDSSRTIQYDSDACYARCEGFVANTGSRDPILDFGDLRRSGCRGGAA